MASRIQAKSPPGGAAPDVPGGLPAAALTGPWPVETGAAARAFGDPGAGELLFAAGSDGFAGAVASGGFAMACEAGRAAGSGRTAVPGGSALEEAGRTGRRSISADGRRVRSIT